MKPIDEVVVTTVDDVLFRDGHALVLVESEVLLLSPVSSEIVSACAEGMSLALLEEHLVATFGPPPAGQTVAAQTQELVRALAEVGVVTTTAGGAD